MSPERALHYLGGVADAAALRGLTSRSRLRVAVRRGLIERVAHGRYALPGTDEGIRAAHRLSGVLVEDSAAQYHGWEMKHPPRSPCVAVSRKRHLAARQGVGVRVRFLDIPGEDVSGLATRPGETVMRCAARLPFDEALAIADSALRHLDVSRGELLERAAAMSVRYRARCLRVAQCADGRAANPFESVLRAIALDVPGLHVEPQVWIDPVGRPDLLDVARGIVIEADSFEFHGRRRALKADCERYNGFVLAGFVVVRFSWEHVMHQPEYVRSVLLGVTERPPRPALPDALRRLSA